MPKALDEVCSGLNVLANSTSDKIVPNLMEMANWLLKPMSIYPLEYMLTLIHKFTFRYFTTGQAASTIVRGQWHLKIQIRKTIHKLMLFCATTIASQMIENAKAIYFSDTYTLRESLSLSLVSLKKNSSISTLIGFLTRSIELQ